MGLMDMLMSQVSQNVDVGNLATKVGLTPDQVQGAIGALTQAHTQDGDTVEQAAASTGLPTDQIQQVMDHVGGENALAGYAQMLTQAGGAGGILGALGGAAGQDQDGGGLLGSVAGLAKGFFGSKE